MNTILKRTSIVVAGLFAIAAFCAMIYYVYYKWLQTSVYEEKITVTAYYMKYACGDCSIDMRVKSVDHPKFNFIIGQDIFPIPKTKKHEELCDFIGSVGHESSTGPDYIEESFTLIGHLHKYAHGLPIFDCSTTPFFTVDKIKYGAKGQWKNF